METHEITTSITKLEMVQEEKNVNYPFPPYNLCLLAAIVREKKLVNDVKIIDAYVDDMSIDDVKLEIEKFKPDVVGLTVLMDQLFAMLDM